MTAVIAYVLCAFHKFSVNTSLKRCATLDVVKFVLATIMLMIIILLSTIFR